MIVIVDYGMGNLKSVEKAFKLFIDEIIIVNNDKDLISNADGIILPGVGAFGDAIRELKDMNLWNLLKEKIQETPTIGICLGMQLLFNSSEEDTNEKGFGLIPGIVKKLDKVNGVNVPHTGWNTVSFVNEPFFSGYSYFNHSYYCLPENEDHIIAYSVHGQRIPCIIQYKNMFALQFHPEKSKKLGFDLIKWWLVQNKFIGVS